jgi:hypothetical protein
MYGIWLTSNQSDGLTFVYVDTLVVTMKEEHTMKAFHFSFLQMFGINSRFYPTSIDIIMSRMGLTHVREYT